MTNVAGQRLANCRTNEAWSHVANLPLLKPERCMRSARLNSDGDRADRRGKTRCVTPSLAVGVVAEYPL
ncbi:MAG: hypothetical protein ABW224_17640 [Kibdelosporangium sp.]